MKKVIIIGGGAAGFFTAINAKEMNPELDITILEKGKEVLQKVKISGGGRCNVTHACFEPKELVQFYPRGEKELLGPFHQFMTGDTFEWFENNGIPLKIEKDNRVFPESNSSQTIIDCFLNKTKRLGISVLKNHGVSSIQKQGNSWLIITKEQQFVCDAVVMAAGSSKKVWELSKALGHSIISPVPSLFTFNIKDPRIKDLLGISVPNATVQLVDTYLEASGPLLITHWGMSGPAILKLSAWGARYLHDQNYQFKIQVNWLSIKSEVEVLNLLLAKESSIRKKKICNANPFGLPNRMWVYLLSKVDIDGDLPWFELQKKKMNRLINVLLNDVYSVSCKTTFKEEFVTSGGVDLNEVEVSSMQSKVCKNIYFEGEVLNIDGITGGFNFQSAWTTAYIAGKLNP